MSYERVRYGAAAEILDILYNRALNRFIEHSEFDVRDYLTPEELAQYEAAEAVELEYMLNGPRRLGRVVVEVAGGVAEVTSKPEHVDVEIIDHDNEANE